ncbi:hypothetical protein AB0F15_29220 [Amycolatopsis sp. NPDC026612]|uniref:hypothetical protein n=1 Tax=Amycolatopsis sp. NPDC026612 TaxID=3155466 RepID=UPI0033DB95F1
MPNPLTPGDAPNPGTRHASPPHATAQAELLDAGHRVVSRRPRAAPSACTGSAGATPSRTT